jgi:F0F1-type ATP synthase gamma subunit
MKAHFFDLDTLINIDSKIFLNLLEDHFKNILLFYNHLLNLFRKTMATFQLT